VVSPLPSYHSWIDNKTFIHIEAVLNVTEKMRSNRLACCGHVMQRDESHITKRVTSMNVDGHPSRGRPKKRSMDYVKDDIRIKGVSMEITSESLRMEEENILCRPHLVG
jgi:hypothetical protein